MAANEGKRIRAAREGIEVTKLYPIQDAVKLIKERAKAKFDETIEISMNLGVDPRHADQMVRGVCNLPNGSGRTGWAPRTCSRSSTAARSTSTAASPLPT